MAASSKTVLIIAGPTAVGKTAIAIDAALLLKTAIISADSRQCYKELSIGVARPSVKELEEVPHYFIASHSIKEEMTAAGFEQYALQEINELFKTKDAVVMTGGTGLYIKAFCEGLDEIPTIPAEIRNKVVDLYKINGLEWLQEQVKEKDPVFYEVGEIQNPQRMMRALEVVEATGQSIIDFRKGGKTQHDFRIVKIALELPREELNQRINTRVDQMIEAGLLEEVRRLMPYRHLNALQTVGYAELFDHLEGKISLSDAVELIKQHTRQYAKRQMTWFRKDKEIQWFNAKDAKAILSYCARIGER